MTTAKMALPAMSEAEWQDQVIELAELLGWRVMHVRRSKGRHLAAELKSETGKVAAEQELVLFDLAESGVETHMWRPSDFAEVEIVSVRVEPISIMISDKVYGRIEMTREGFDPDDWHVPGSGGTGPISWVRWWLQSHGINEWAPPYALPTEQCRRIEWRYLDQVPA